MGIDANFILWIGTKDELPQALEDKIEEEGEEIFEDDFYFQYFYKFDEIVGYGTEILSHSHYNKMVEMDLVKFNENIDKAIEKIKIIFKKWGVNQDPQIYYYVDLN